MNQWNQMTEHLVHLMEEEINDCTTPCAAIGIVHKGEIVWEKHLGYADIANEQLITPESIYRIYSMTKPITAVAIHILLERGLLDYYDPVGKYLPAFTDMQVYTEQGQKKADRQMLVIDLLRMTSGLVYPDTDPAGRQMAGIMLQMNQAINAGRGLNLQQICERVGALPLAFSPGERWRYGFSADVAGAIIEVITGESLGSFYQREIFEPLQMHDTAFYVPEEKKHRLTKFYAKRVSKRGTRLEEFENCNLGVMDYYEPPAFESGGAGLFSTLSDYMKFGAMLANTGSFQGVRILGKKTVELLAQNQLSNDVKATIYFDQIKGHGYGNFMRMYENMTEYGSSGSIGEFGWDGWTGPYLSVDRKENMAIVVMHQTASYNHPNMIRRLRNVIYSAL